MFIVAASVRLATVELSISLFLLVSENIYITGQWRVRHNTRVSGTLYCEMDESTVVSRTALNLTGES